MRHRRYPHLSPARALQSDRQEVIDMMLNSGDLVFPSDLPRRFLCRVEEVETIGLASGPFQIMTLAPLEGPWTPSTRLVRTNQNVLVPSRGEASRRGFSRPASAQRVVRRRSCRLRQAS